MSCAFRYLIQGDMPPKPLQRYAVNRQSGLKVLLKFYPWPYTAFGHSIYMHQRTNDNRYVCQYLTPTLLARTPSAEASVMFRMVEVLLSPSDFPPCIVVERGDCTLSDIIEQGHLFATDRRAILYNVCSLIQMIRCLIWMMLGSGAEGIGESACVRNCPRRCASG